VLQPMVAVGETVLICSLLAKTRVLLSSPIRSSCPPMVMTAESYAEPVVMIMVFTTGSDGHYFHLPSNQRWNFFLPPVCKFVV